MVQTRSRGPALADINPGGAAPAGQTAAGQTAGRGGQRGQRGSQRGGRGGRGGGSAPRNPISPTPRLPSPSPESNHSGQPPRDEEMSKVDFLKLAKDFPTFSGDNGVQPEDYLVQFSKMAKFTSFSSVQLMEVIPLKFTSIADTWFQQFQKSEDWQFLTYSDDPFATFCEFFIKRFSFGERNQLARDKLRSLEWRGNVVKLASLIQQHAAHTDITDSEQCDCFIRLLPTEMAEHVLLMRTVLGHHSFSEAITMAVNYASSSSSRKMKYNGQNSGQRKKFQSGHASGSASGQGKHSSGQRQGKSPYNNNNGVQKSSKTGVKPSVPGRKCWGCGSPDHLKKDCPKATTGVNMMDVDVKAQIIDLGVVSTDMITSADGVPTCANQLLIMEGSVSTLPVKVMIDGGAGATFITGKCAKRLNLHPRTRAGSITVRLANGNSVTVPLRISTYRQSVRMFVLDVDSAVGIILGKNWLEFHNPHIDWRLNTVEFVYQDQQILLSTSGADAAPAAPTSETSLISATQLARILRNKNTPAATNDDDDEEFDEDGDLIPRLTTDEDPWANIHETYEKEYFDVFDLRTFFPPERNVQHEIPLEPGHMPPCQRPYRISPREMEELQKQIREMIDAGIIQPSSSPYAAPVIFVPKQDGTLRMCVDYRALNKITIKDKFPLPKMDELLNCLEGARYFSKIDLKSAYYQVRVKEEDIPKTAFNTRYGHYEFRVMPFGLTNAPATFQKLMNNIFADSMEKFLVVYLDDILIFSKTAEEHDRHIRYVLDRLREHQLHAGLQKCRFFQTEIEFVGYLLTAEGIHMLPKKVDAILNWPVPTTASQVKSFLGLATFYRHFVEHFAHKAIPLYQITRKNQIFTWLPRHQEAFEQLKLALTTAPVLAPPDFNLPFEIHTDASDFAAGAVLSQEGNHPIAFLSHVFKPAELNYSTQFMSSNNPKGPLSAWLSQPGGSKRTASERSPQKAAPTSSQNDLILPLNTAIFLAIILALRAWRHYIHGHPTTVYTDHQALISIQTQTFVNRRHNRYLQFLAEFGNDLIIKYKPGRSNVVADALSRIPNLNSISTLGPSPELLHEFAVAYVSDPLTETFFTGGAGPSKWSLHDGFIYAEKNGEKLIYVPASKSLKDLIIHDHHDAAIAGHLGRDKTIAAIGTTYTWPGMREDIARYVAECPTCQVVKSSNQVTPGLLSSLDIPCRRWEQIHIDLIGPLPATPRGFDAIVTIVDRLSKAAVFIPTTMTVTARQLAELFFNNVFRHYGLPSIIISDRDPRFTSNFWRALMDHLGISLHMTAAYHPQSDGQAERHNRTIQDMLRAYVNPSTRDDWDEHLVALEFAYNNSVNRATGFSPFFMLYGQNPNTPASLLRATVSLSPAVDDFLARITETLTQSLAEVLNDNAYVLHLPPRLKNTSSTFNVTQLKRYQETDREFPRPPPIGYESGQPLYEFEKILAHRGPKNNRDYLVKWKGWPVDENLYEPASNLSGVQADVDAYEASIPVQRRKRSRR
ncbi:hypothetical protein KSW81_006082 [Nannochloris sp. 'desiccata']|nr:hypothetical protein KSW81_006082 [Chlorella desiccata (nom. nud.)]